MTTRLGTKPKSVDRSKASRHGNVPPRNPNKRQTTINMERSIGRMKANDMEAIRQAR